MKDLILKVLKEQTEKLSLPLTIKGSYKAPKGDGDALHSFERRKSDKFGGRMSSKINRYLEKVYKQLGVNPDITNITIKVDSVNYFVEWTATIDESKDGKAYMGIITRGSAGGGADRRAQGQLSNLMNRIKESGGSDATLVFDFVNPKGVYIRQFFYKYTLPSKYPPLSQSQKLPTANANPIVIDTGGPENEPLTAPTSNGSLSSSSSSSSTQSVDTSKQENEFKSWQPGEYELKNDSMWIYRLNNDKQWETKKRSGGDYKLMKTALSSGNYSQALSTLKNAKKIVTETFSLKTSIKNILREETDKQMMDERILRFLKRRHNLEVKDLSMGEDEKPLIVKTMSFNIQGDWYNLNSFMSKKEMVGKLLNMLQDNNVISLGEYNRNIFDTDRQKVVRTIKYFLDNTILK